MNNRQEIEQIIDGMTLFDDDLMSKCFDGNIPATEFLIKTILNRDDIHVVRVKGQVELNNPLVGGRNIRLDILAEDDKGVQMNLEVQRSNVGADVRRARFHSSMVDSQMLLSSQGFKELKDSYVIFITEKDYFKAGKPIYTVERHVHEINEEFSDGSHIIYVNGAYEGDDDIGKLIHDFHCKQASDIYNAELAESVRHFKEEGGKSDMCEAVEKYATEREIRGKIEATIKAGIEFGADKEAIVMNLIKNFSLTLEEAEKVYDDVVAVSL